MENQQGGFMEASSIGLTMGDDNHVDFPKLTPALERNKSGRLGRHERFSNYLARQIGFEDPNECPTLCKLANDYLKRSDGCESAIFEFLEKDPKAESLYVKLIEELERCILTYFAFHWPNSSHMISQVLEGDDSHEKNKTQRLCHGCNQERCPRRHKQAIALVGSATERKHQHLSELRVDLRLTNEMEQTRAALPDLHEQGS